MSRESQTTQPPCPGVCRERENIHKICPLNWRTEWKGRHKQVTKLYYTFFVCQCTCFIREILFLPLDIWCYFLWLPVTDSYFDPRDTYWITRLRNLIYIQSLLHTVTSMAEERVSLSFIIKVKDIMETTMPPVIQADIGYLSRCNYPIPRTSTHSKTPYCYEANITGRGNDCRRCHQVSFHKRRQFLWRPYKVSRVCHYMCLCYRCKEKQDEHIRW